MENKAHNRKVGFETPQLIMKGEYSLVVSMKCSRRMSGKNHCSIRPNTN